MSLQNSPRRLNFPKLRTIFALSRRGHLGDNSAHNSTSSGLLRAKCDDTARSVDSLHVRDGHVKDAAQDEAEGVTQDVAEDVLGAAEDRS